MSASHENKYLGDILHIQVFNISLIKVPIIFKAQLYDNWLCEIFSMFMKQLYSMFPELHKQKSSFHLEKMHEIISNFKKLIEKLICMIPEAEFMNTQFR
jgi:hypothetical protein